MVQLLASAPTEEALTKLINQFWHSENYIIKDGKPYNNKTGNIPKGYRIYKKAKRWRFEFDMELFDKENIPPVIIK